MTLREQVARRFYACLPGGEPVPSFGRSRIKDDLLALADEAIRLALWWRSKATDWDTPDNEAPALTLPPDEWHP